MTKLAPARLASQTMGVWFLATSLGNLLAGLFAGGMSTATAPSRDSAAMATSAEGRVSISTPTRTPWRTPTRIRPRTTLLMRRLTPS